MEFFRNDWQFVCASVEEVVKKRYWEKSIFILFRFKPVFISVYIVEIQCTVLILKIIFWFYQNHLLKERR